MFSVVGFLILLFGICHAATPSSDLVMESIRPSTPTPIPTTIDSKISIDELITIGKQFWNIIKDGKPVVNYQVDWAGEFPPT